MVTVEPTRSWRLGRGLRANRGSRRQGGPRYIFAPLSVGRDAAISNALPPTILHGTHRLGAPGLSSPLFPLRDRGNCGLFLATSPQPLWAAACWRRTGNLPAYSSPPPLWLIDALWPEILPRPSRKAIAHIKCAETHPRRRPQRPGSPARRTRIMPRCPLRLVVHPLPVWRPASWRCGFGSRSRSGPRTFMGWPAMRDCGSRSQPEKTVAGLLASITD